MPQQKPSIGRTVHVLTSSGGNHGADVAAAIITRVHEGDDNLVNIKVMLDGYHNEWRTGVKLDDDDDVDDVARRVGGMHHAGGRRAVDEHRAHRRRGRHDAGRRRALVLDVAGGLDDRAGIGRHGTQQLDDDLPRRSGTAGGERGADHPDGAHRDRQRLVVLIGQLVVDIEPRRRRAAAGRRCSDLLELAVVAGGQRPGSSWPAPVIRGAQIGFVLTGLQPGFYQVWAQATDGSNEPVIDCGMFQVT